MRKKGKKYREKENYNGKKEREWEFKRTFFNLKLLFMLFLTFYRHNKYDKYRCITQTTTWWGPSSASKLLSALL